MNYNHYLKSDHWRLLRGAKLQISPKCEVCGSREEIEVHHKLYRDTWFETKLKDLRTLCHYHHVCEHVKGATEADKQRLLKAEEDKVFKDWKYRTNFQPNGRYTLPSRIKRKAALKIGVFNGFKNPVTPFVNQK